jgi:hypothetical protein
VSNSNPGVELRDLAKKYLNDKIMPDVIDLLIAGDHKTVKVTILGAVDSLFSAGKIDGSEASSAYQKLGIPPKVMFQIRTNVKVSN